MNSQRSDKDALLPSSNYSSELQFDLWPDFFYGFFCPLKARRPHQIISVLVFLTLWHQMGLSHRIMGIILQWPAPPTSLGIWSESMCLTLLPSQGNYKADFFPLAVLNDTQSSHCLRPPHIGMAHYTVGCSLHKDICTDWDLLWLRIRRILFCLLPVIFSFGCSIEGSQ